ncbi:C4-dicarboxylate ABC transporter substrate-binding protein [Amycolatopsis coloradensis]|uniref:C4-dicarboxylate ABC transporter substrate-binding protein n=1 Tax=Amycolatopsis coloradensis TaxID=76021 RepID=A0A1R0L3B1_9PSEU|nr:TAXI family TRAP transporter solute-binding subunit [Amycolatopsis coloradensis]OLZ57239.1 C4-dicarboxylate ABC transporter substrate-binding protein [Amycolatopsis coloradensis]
MRRPRVLAAVAAVVCVLVTGCGPDLSGSRVRIAAGLNGGVYDKLAEPLADAWAAELDSARPEVQETQGSPDNISRVRAGKADVAFVAADVATENTAGLAALARVHDDYLHVVVRADSPITSFAQLRGRKVAIGSPDSGVEYLSKQLLKVSGLTGAIDRRNLGLTEALPALENRQIDAVIWSGGVPTPSITERVRTVGLRLLDITDLADALRATSPVYRTATIPVTAYNLKTPVTTLVLPNFLVVPSSMSDDLAEALVRGLFDARGALAKAAGAALSIDIHPAIETAPLPLHPGALRYFRSLKD